MYIDIFLYFVALIFNSRVQYNN